MVQLRPHEGKSLEHGYVVKNIAEASVNRVLVAGDVDRLDMQTNMMKNLSTHTQEVTVYTSTATKDLGKQV
jgi:hypothetical protein